MTDWHAAWKEVVWQLERFGFAKFLDIAFAWTVVTLALLAVLVRLGRSFAEAGLISLYSGEISVLSILYLLQYSASQHSFLEYSFARTLHVKKRRSLLSRGDQAWEYVGRWLDRNLHSRFGEAFVLKNAREDPALRDQEHPASVKGMMWAVAAEMFEQSSDDTQPWEKTSKFMEDVRKTFMLMRIDSTFRENLTKLYMKASPSYRMTAAKPGTGETRNFAGTHPILTTATIAIVSAVIGGVIAAVPLLLR